MPRLAALLVLMVATAVHGTTMQPVPRLGVPGMEPAVRQQIEAAYGSVATAPTLPAAEAAAAFGEAGKTFLLYSLSESALPCFENATALAPKDVRWAYFAGIAARLRGELDRAGDHFRQALALQSPFPAALVRLGEVEILRDDLESAKRAYTAALASPDAAAAHFGLGRVALLRGDARLAAEHFEATLAAQPAASIVHSQLAIAYRRLGQVDKAAAQAAARGEGVVRFADTLMSQLEGANASNANRITLALRALQEGRFAAAAEALRQAAAVDPRDVRIWLRPRHAPGSPGDAAARASRASSSCGPRCACARITKTPATTSPRPWPRRAGSPRPRRSVTPCCSWRRRTAKRGRCATSCAKTSASSRRPARRRRRRRRRRPARPARPASSADGTTRDPASGIDFRALASRPRPPPAWVRRPARRFSLAARRLPAAFATTVLLFAMSLVAAGCGRAPGGASAAGTWKDAPIVLISIDTLRSDHLPAYGYRRVETPAIDALRRDAVLFTRAYSHVPLTLPSHCSILSGRLPGDHGVRDNVGYHFDAATHQSLPMVLKQAGYATGGAVSAYVLRVETGISRGFDFWDSQVAMQFSAGLAQSRRPGQETARLALDWLHGVAGRPFFLFLHLYEPHSPYTPPEPFASRYKDSPYDGEIANADAVVGGVLAELRRLGVYERAVGVLLSDHGEGLGEHGEAENGMLLYRTTLQVPLLLKLPGARRGGTRGAAPARRVE